MLLSVALFTAGEALLLGGVAAWSPPAAMILAGGQALAVGLLRVAGPRGSRGTAR